MKKFLVTHNAVVGRTKEDGSDHSPINLVFYTVNEAASEEAVQDQLVRYSDPGFVTNIASVAELGDDISADDLYALMKPELVISEMQ